MVLDADGKPELIEESRPLDLPLYRFPVFGLLSIGIGAVALGVPDMQWAHRVKATMTETINDPRLPDPARCTLIKVLADQAGLTDPILGL
ncbi:MULTISPECIES: hypothetical protein [Halomonadaceae]|uniref:hypothetical protein n=1 Tax=Halomonadaceae TaxID=28256 RepID=UPI000C34AEBA|nr:hypothetical protein [Halomonas sp. MES3-P3E]PKG52538.1 hypothetical protein CXF87_08810 [Halomonas sp. MES3-P3E]